jgi:cyclopropane fatty-acyl-phospholipid synthase-like methyltransferase
MSQTNPQQQAKRFDEVYRRDDQTYGAEPSQELIRYVDQCLRGGGKALDLAAGLGRDSLALAERGLHVTAVDVAEEGLQHLAQEADKRGLTKRIDTVIDDITRYTYPPRTFTVIVATTAFDHIERAKCRAVLPKVAAALTDNGVLYAEVHTTEDPGSPTGFGRKLNAPLSETAAAIAHYFEPNELLRLLAEHLRIIHYEERREWDHTHGRPHVHGKAIALAVPKHAHPPYHGDSSAQLADSAKSNPGG